VGVVHQPDGKEEKRGGERTTSSFSLSKLGDFPICFGRSKGEKGEKRGERKTLVDPFFGSDALLASGEPLRRKRGGTKGKGGERREREGSRRWSASHISLS